MNLKVNSNKVKAVNGSNLLSLMVQLSLDQKDGIAIAVNAEVIPKKEWSLCSLSEDDEIIIIEAAQGG